MAKKSGENYPSFETVERQLGGGSWTDAVISVGLQPGGNRGRDKKYSKEDTKTALKQATEDIGESPSRRQYYSWQEQQSVDHPSPMTIAKRLGDGSWRAAKKTVLQNEE